MIVSYRKLLPDEAKAYRAIRLESLQCHPENFGSRYEEQKNLPELRLEKAIRMRDASMLVIGAFADDQLIGIGALTLGNIYGLTHAGSLLQMYVRASFSGQKVGLGLTQAIQAEALAISDINGVVLEVNKKNAKAITVYQQAGFQFIEDSKVSSGNETSQLMLWQTARHRHNP